MDRPDPTPRPSLEARLQHGAPGEPPPQEDAVLPPLHASTNYRFPDVQTGAEAFDGFRRRARGELDLRTAWVYERWEQPTVARLEARLADAAAARWALAFTTGMAAVAAVAAVQVPPGGRVVLQRPVYGGTEELFRGHAVERLGAELVVVDDLAPEAVAEAAGAAPTHMVHLESPANPSVEVVDLEGVAKALDRLEPRPLFVVDNTFAGPWCQRPLDHGVDLVVESLTKTVSGFGAAMGGMVAGGEDQRQILGRLLGWRASGGTSLAPGPAWEMLVHGLPTLGLRMRRQTETAGRLARALAEEPGLSVDYPGLASHPGHEIARRQMLDPDGNFAPGCMVHFSFEGETESAADRARRFLDHVARHARCVTLAASLGQIGTLVEAPALMSHSEAIGATPTHPGGVRLSVGIEPFEDLWSELAPALEAGRAS